VTGKSTACKKLVQFIIKLEEQVDIETQHKSSTPGLPKHGLKTEVGTTDLFVHVLF